MKNVLKVSKSSNWLLADTNFSVQARAFKRSGADMMIISSHPFTTCGMLKEMRRQRIRPKVLVGLTSSSSAETLKGCSAAAEGIYIPTGFAPITKAAAKVAAAAEANGGAADLHSAAAWENAHIIKQVVEATGVMAKSSRLLKADRRKVRDGLEALVQGQWADGRDRTGPERGGIHQALRLRASPKGHVESRPRSALTRSPMRIGTGGLFGAATW